jgi:hypothetical protein
MGKKGDTEEKPKEIYIYSFGGDLYYRDVHCHSQAVCDYDGRVRNQ